MKKTTISLDDADREAIAEIREHAGQSSTSAAIRFALRETARAIRERRTAQRTGILEAFRNGRPMADAAPDFPSSLGSPGGGKP